LIAGWQSSARVRAAASGALGLSGTSDVGAVPALKVPRSVSDYVIMAFLSAALAGLVQGSRKRHPPVAPAAPAPPAPPAPPAVPRPDASVAGSVGPPVTERPAPLRAVAAPATVEPPAVEPPAAPRATILLVDDDDAVRDSTMRILQRANFEVLCAASAADAIAVFQAHAAPIDLLLSDVVMPGASGVELAADITRLAPETAILLISGYTPSALKHHRLLSRASYGVQLLQKPIAPAELVSAIRDAISVGRPHAV
jgi:CheY-like chemotaxis protein